jgi:hypothetical protein
VGVYGWVVCAKSWQLPPGTPIGVAIGTEIAPAHPAARGTPGVGVEMRGGVHLAAAPPRGHDARGRGAGCLWTEVAGLRTGIAVRLYGEALKRLGLTLALGLWGWGSGVVEHAAAGALGHTHWSMTHSHTRAISTNW